MNYYQARQRESDKKWDWTAMNDGKVFKVPPCSEGCNHDTQEEAERHHYDYELTKLRVWNESGQHKCRVCPEWTQRVVDDGHARMAHVCEKHDVKEAWQEIYPFSPGVQVMSSY